MDASTSSAPPSSSPSSSVLSSFSPLSSSSLSKLSPSLLCHTLYDDADTYPTPKPSLRSLVRRRNSSYTWFSRLLRLHNNNKKLSMEAHEGLLLHKPSQGDAEENKGAEKPRRELRFAAKIAAAMDADGFIGVKDSVCADVLPNGIKQAVCQNNLATLYCSSSNRTPQKAPSRRARPRRRWKLCKRLRRTRVLFVCMLHKIRKVFTASSKRTLQVQDGLIK